MTYQTKKKLLCVRIDAELDRRLRECIVSSYGSYKGGLLSFEVAQALQMYLATKRQQGTLVQVKNNPIPKVHVLKERVKAWLKEMRGYEIVYQVNKKHLIEAISALRGNDQRTILKWLKEFDRYKVIKWISPQLVEFV
jgi:hypothetical protein